MKSEKTQKYIDDNECVYPMEGYVAKYTAETALKPPSKRLRSGCGRKRSVHSTICGLRTESSNRITSTTEEISSIN